MKQVETSRETVFNARIESSICEEIPSEANPYLAQEVRLHGYDLFELAGKVNLAQALFLLFSGELPTPEQEELLTKWWIFIMNPGPRHPAVRAAMNASVGKTHASSMLPIGLSILGGEHLGCWEVKSAMTFIERNLSRSPETVSVEDTPGFGSRMGGIDPIPGRALEVLASLKGAGPALKWAHEFNVSLASKGRGCLMTGLAAATLKDLGFNGMQAIGLFQFFCAPGILAHGNEMIGKPLTSMPFPKDDAYIIEGGSHD